MQFAGGGEPFTSCVLASYDGSLCDRERRSDEYGIARFRGRRGNIHSFQLLFHSTLSINALRPGASDPWPVILFSTPDSNVTDLPKNKAKEQKWTTTVSNNY
jgi:hypothetical protein